LIVNFRVGQDNILKNPLPHLRWNELGLRDRREMDPYGVVAFAGVLGKMVLLELMSKRLARQPRKFGLQ
jgi:hypothetical protein